VVHCELLQRTGGELMDMFSNLVRVSLSRSSQLSQQVAQQVRTGWLIASAQGDLKL
jgi:hypothetical protein